VVWANVIGLMLAFLALGYWLGGRAADARPEPELLGQILLAASLLLAATPFAARPLCTAPSTVSIRCRSASLPACFSACSRCSSCR
jgi:hypothetical protein